MNLENMNMGVHYTISLTFKYDLFLVGGREEEYIYFFLFINIWQ